MRTLVSLTALAVAALLPGAVWGQTPERPNVLFVSVDELNSAVGFLSEAPEAPEAPTALTEMELDDHTLRTERYRYIRFNNEPDHAELYDAAADPDERVNLIHNPAASGARLEMGTRLDLAHAEIAVPVALTLPPPEASGGGTALLATAPNPARTQTSGRYHLTGRTEVTISIYDALGRRMTVLAQGLREPGPHRADLDTTPLAPGTYTIPLTARGETASERLLVLR